MTGWRLFWALVGYVAFIVILIFLYFYKPFEDFFTLVINGLGYDNAMFWVVLIAAIVSFCAFHWRAYRLGYLCKDAASTAWSWLRCAARLLSPSCFAPAPQCSRY